MSTACNRAHTFFETHVIPAVDEWRKNPDQIRLAMNLAVALNQMADHYWHGFAKSEPARVFNTRDVKSYRGQLGKQNTQWALVRDVAEAHKHVKLDRSNRAVTSAGQTVVTPTAYGQSAYGTGPHGGTPSVVITLDRGATVHFSSVVSDVITMWQSLLT